VYICPKARFEKEKGLIMHKQTWQHYTKMPEEKTIDFFEETIG